MHVHLWRVVWIQITKFNLYQWRAISMLTKVTRCTVAGVQVAIPLVDYM